MLDGEKRIDLLLHITAHALILCGLLCVILTGEIPLPLWLLALAAHPLSFLMKPKKGMYFNVIVILAFTYFLFLFFALESPFLAAFTQFLIVVQAVKLFHLDTSKDYYQLAGLGLFTVLAAAGLTSHFYYLFFLFTLLLFGIWFLFLLHLKGSREKHPALPKPPRQLTSPSLFLGITGVALCSFLITILIFFTLPRITLSISGREQAGGTSSGFADVVDLGTIGAVSLDNRVVMRVELPQYSERPQRPFYWRGTSFARWDGRAWGKEDTKEKIIRISGGVSFRPLTDNTATIHQIIMIEPMDTDVIFCLHPPLRIRGDFHQLLIDEGGGLHLPSLPLLRTSYEVYSAPQSLGEGAQQPLHKPAVAYLHLPEGEKKIAALACEIVAGAPSSDKKVTSVISYLQSNCAYSLNPKRDERFPPIEDFVLHSREGYCEHFATAAALLLRGAGVPTRLVSGFLGGEWNSLGKYLMVRQRNAHTWIEAYLPDKGWVPFDPTPPGGETVAIPPLAASLYRYYDFLKLKWNRYFIRYSRHDQYRILMALRQTVLGLRLFPHVSALEKLRAKNARFPAYLLAAIAALTFIVLIAWKIGRRRSAQDAYRAGALRSDISFYLKMLKALEKKKITKRASETPSEFAERVGHDKAVLFPRLRRVTSLYYRVRFGLIPLTPREEEETVMIIRGLKRSRPSSSSLKS